MYMLCINIIMRAGKDEVNIHVLHSQPQQVPAPTAFQETVHEEAKELSNMSNDLFSTHKHTH